MITSANTIYVTPAHQIGKHEWRCVVFQHDRYGPCTHWQWKASGPHLGSWRSQYDWPKYDHNDTYDGLPRSLGKIYRAHYADIQTALGKQPQQQQTLV